LEGKYFIDNNFQQAQDVLVVAVELQIQSQTQEKRKTAGKLQPPFLTTRHPPKDSSTH
jgi:hypothetical protein